MRRRKNNPEELMFKYGRDHFIKRKHYDVLVTKDWLLDEHIAYFEEQLYDKLSNNQLISIFNNHN